MNKQKKTSGTFIRNNSVNHLLEGVFILTLCFSAFLLLSLTSYEVNNSGDILNAGGKIGASVANIFYWILGYTAYVLPVFLTYASAMLVYEQRILHDVDKLSIAMRASGLLMILTSVCVFLSLQISANALTGVYLPGGIIGTYIAVWLNNYLSLYGSLLLIFAIFLVGFTWVTGISWVKMIEMVGRVSIFSYNKIIKKLYLSLRVIASTAASLINKLIKSCTNVKKKTSFLFTPEFLFNSKKIPENVDDNIFQNSYEPLKPKKEKLEPRLITDIKVKKEAPVESVKPIARDLVRKKQEVTQGLPGLGLLDKGQPGKPMGGYSNQELEDLSRDVEQHLLDFGVNATVVSVHPGPVITRFELQLAAGVKVSRLTALAKDLARSLSVVSVRVVEIIPGKTVVGIELPNPNRAMVRLSDVLNANVYQKANSLLSLALGVDIAGQPMVVDLAKMPHLLVAGTTGSGKSVGINAMILSLLFRATPEQVRLILIDPKMLELSVYDGIPHLLTPVVTDMREAQSALRWCVGEMERRYKLMASLGVRNLDSYNSLVTDALSKNEPITDPIWKKTDGMSEEAPTLDALPYIVVVIDELADMMMVVGKKVEQLIARIAQKARAAGIHLILATQRPSVDVLTGLIKSNIPTRISFQVSSKIDSRTILDQQGAEQLLGHGDMLFLAPGTGAPLRVHGAFVDDKEVHRIAEDWRGRGQPQYIESITQNTDDNADGEGFNEDRGNSEDNDPLYDQVVEFVIQTRKASISSVQRRFKIGYNRAARLVEEMERTGLVGPLEGGLRDVLVPSED